MKHNYAKKHLVGNYRNWDTSIKTLVLIFTLLLAFNHLTFSQTKLTGTIIGTSGAYNNGPDTKEKTMDGNTSTYFDAAQSDGNWVGLDLSGTYTLTQFRFYPRGSYAYRMTGGKIQGSNTADFSSGVVDLYTIATQPADGAWSSVSITNASTFRYFRYLSPNGAYGNVAEVEFYGTSVTSAKLSGTIIGTAGAYNNGSDTKEKTMDGNTSTFFDAAQSDGNWVGLDLSGNYTLSQVRFYPRSTFAFRMTNGKFQGSNTADFSSGVVDLYTITTQPADGIWTNASITNSSAFRYVRYLSPAGAYGNVAEVEFYGSLSGSTVAVTGVTIAPDNATISVGSTASLTATIAPADASNQSATWASSNNAIATVSSSGVITGVAMGTATITITTQDGAKTASCAVTVTGTSTGTTIPATIQAESYFAMLGVQTEPTTDTDGGLNVGWIDASDWMEYPINVTNAGTFTIDLRIASTTTASVQIMDGSTLLATVSIPNTNGWQTWQTVTSSSFNLTAGSKTIRLTAVSGGWNINWLQFKTSTSSISVTGVSINPTSTSVNVGSSTTLTATVVPSNATNQTVSYSSSDNNVATVNASGMVTGVAAGSATITVTTNDGAKTATCAVTVSPVTPTSEAHAIGINLAWTNDWVEDRLFTDAWKTCRPEWYKAPNWGEPNPRANVDANGWPTEDAVVAVWDVANMNGTYALSFNGQAESITAGFGGGTISNMAYDVNTNTTTATFIRNTSVTSLSMQFTGTKRTASSAVGTGITNIKLMRPITVGGTTPYATNVTFTNEIKALVSKFNVIRTMDMQSTQGNPQVNWSDRALTTHSTQATPVGVAWEYIIQLANETEKDLWIQIPHKASDAYITSLANLIYTTLNSNLKVYIEYSNEVWNTAGGFPQGNELHEIAKAEVAAGGSPLNFDGETNDWVWTWRYIAKRMVTISNIFRAKFGDAAMMTRIRPVLEWQQANGQSTANEICHFMFKYYNNSQYVSNPHPMNYYVYGGGGSAYYSPNNHDPNLTLDNIWSNGGFNVNTWTNDLKPDIDYCAAFGIKRTAYEGGPGLDISNNSEAVKAAAVNDDRMTTCLTQHQTTWDNYGGDVLVYYKSTGDYQWGFTQTSLDLTTKKYAAIDIIKNTNRAPITYAPAAPTTISGLNRAFDKGNWGWTYADGFHLKEHHYASFIFRVTSPGTYNVSAYLPNVSGTITFYCDGVKLGSENGVPGNTSKFTMPNLQVGLHGVIIETGNNGGDGCDLNSVTIDLGNGTKSANVTTDVAQASDVNITIYPNPTTDKLLLNFGRNIENALITVFDMQGRNVFQKSVNNTNTENIDVAHLSNGLYLLKISGAGNLYNIRFIKK